MRPQDPRQHPLAPVFETCMILRVGSNKSSFIRLTERACNSSGEGINLETSFLCEMPFKGNWLKRPRKTESFEK